MGHKELVLVIGNGRLGDEESDYLETAGSKVIHALCIDQGQRVFEENLSDLSGVFIDRRCGDTTQLRLLIEDMRRQFPGPIVATALAENVPVMMGAGCDYAGATRNTVEEMLQLLEAQKKAAEAVGAEYLETLVFEIREAGNPLFDALQSVI